MTIGEGIFWSTIVVVVFASVVLLTKYKRWRAFWKTLALIVFLGVLVGLGNSFYIYYKNRPQATTSLNGIDLGMSEVEVTLAKGEPDTVYEIVDTDGYRKFLFYEGCADSSFTTVALRGPKDSVQVTDVCDVRGYGTVLGFGRWTSEHSLTEKLGDPASVSINKEGTRKMLNYPQWNASFQLAEGSVVEVCVTNSQQRRYSEEYDGKKSNGTSTQD